MFPIYALPGFLGLPSDWEALRKALPLFYITPIDPYQVNQPEHGLSKWAEEFSKILRSEKKPPILLGYSMGARLCMHTFLGSTNLVTAMILISGNPGLQTQEEKRKRLALDCAWAKRFQKEPWQSLMRAWNNRAVFSATPINRYEKDYCRNDLSSALINWSLAHQVDFSTSIKQAPFPILWITGKLDQAYSNRLKTLKFSHPLSQSRIICSSGHRVPWEQPRAFLAILEQFLHLTIKNSL
jgi:2-succinyl-6-hydroxy-2,4-cyclohexadiene-1-carboxylate synthase